MPDVVSDIVGLKVASSSGKVQLVRIGVPREQKEDEYRVAIDPCRRERVTHAGHLVLVEHEAGEGSSISDREYEAAGAQIIEKAADLWAESELVCKVKEPLESEYGHLRDHLVLFTYLHLAASRSLTEVLLDQQVTSLAYETVELENHFLPLLAPMSEIAGRMAPMVGAEHLQVFAGGRGVLMGGVPGVRPARVVVLGAGTAGANAAAIAVGMHAEVTVFDQDLARLRALDHHYAGRIQTVASSSHAIEEACRDADLVIGAVLITGARAPRLVSDTLVAEMPSGSVLVDISIDQGGCFESSRPTTHSHPTYRVRESIFYCVANMPGALPRTSTFALTNATLPYVLDIAEFGWQRACRGDPALARGLNTIAGVLVNSAVATAHNLPTQDLDHVLNSQ